MVERRFTAGMTRAERSQQLSEGIRSAALVLLADQGVDALSMQRVAAAAGLSTGPLYARYDAPEDLVVELWASSLRDELGMLLDDVAAWCDEPGPPPSHLARSLAEPSQAQRALIETLAVVRRYPFAAEEIRADLGQDLAQVADATASLPRSVPTSLAAVVLGALLLSPFATAEGPDSAGALLEQMGAMLLGIDRAVDVRREPVPRVASLRIPESGDEVADAFVRGAVLVTARSGYDRATTNRIARAAGRAFTSSYSRFRSKDEILRHSAEAMLGQLLGWSPFELTGLDRGASLELALSLQLGALSEEGRLWRQLRVELAIAARHHEDLAEAFGAALGRSRGELLERLGHRAGALEPEMRATALSIWSLTRAHQFGMAVLAGAAELGSVLDWTPSIALLLDLVDDEVLEPLGLLGPEGA